jgi:hypothetical protein
MIEMSVRVRGIMALALAGVLLASCGSGGAALSTTTSTQTVSTTQGASDNAPGELSDGSGSAIHVSLLQYMALSGCSPGSVVVAFRIRNIGSTLLTTPTYLDSGAVSLVDSSSTPWTQIDGNGCSDLDNTSAMGVCAHSTGLMDLSPGNWGTWCPEVTFPRTSTLAQIQFNASLFFSPAFTGAGVSNVLTWSV